MTAPRTTGATSATAKNKRTLWPWLLLAALVAGLLIWWLLAALDDDDDTDAGAETGVEEITEPVDDDIADGLDDAEDVAPTSPVAPSTIAVGAVLLGDIDLLDPDADVTGLVGETVEANTVDVAQVVADEAFYIGPEPGRTIMVRLPEFAGENAPESPFEVEAGDQVSVTGTLQEIDEALLADLQLFEGTPQLETGDFYVQADDITLVE